MTTYRTLPNIPNMVSYESLHEVCSYLTAGARAERGTEPKPAALTAVACKRPSRTLTPTGIASIACVPISRTRKKNQSVKLDKLFECQRKQIEVWWKRLYLRATTTVRRNHVWCDGNKYTKQRRGWSSRKRRVACVRGFLTILDNIQLHRLSVCIASKMTKRKAHIVKRRLIRITEYNSKSGYL